MHEMHPDSSPPFFRPLPPPFFHFSFFISRHIRGATARIKYTGSRCVCHQDQDLPTRLATGKFRRHEMKSYEIILCIYNLLGPFPPPNHQSVQRHAECERARETQQPFG